MADWRGEDITAAQRYRDMAVHGYRHASPSLERVSLAVADDEAVLGLIAELPVPQQQPNLVFAAARWLGAPLESYAAFRPWLVANWPSVASIARERRTQTNEVRRMATLLPALPPGPLSIIEVGASAGLCLFPDRWQYRYEPGGVVGPPGPLLTCATSGPVPVPAELPTIAWRVGLDLSPLDVTADTDVAWLRTLIWPEQTDRLARLDEAVAIARADPPRLVSGDLRTDLEPLVDEAPVDTTVVVFHSAVLAYVDAAGRAAFVAMMHRLIDERGVVWITNEGPGVLPGTDIDVGSDHFVITRDGVPIARSGQHGRSLHWLG